MADTPFTRQRINKYLTDFSELHRQLIPALADLTRPGQRDRADYTEARDLLRGIETLIPIIREQIGLQESLEDSNLVTLLRNHLWEYVDDIPLAKENKGDDSKSATTRKNRRKL